MLFIGRSLDGGGAQRGLVLMLRHLARDRFQPMAALLQPTGVFRNEVPADVPVYDLGWRRRHALLGPAVALARLIRSTRPAIVVAFQRRPTMLALMLRRTVLPGVPIIATVGTHLTSSLRSARAGAALMHRLYRHLLPASAAIIAISRGVRDDLVSEFAVCEDRIEVIYNPCDFERVERLARETPDRLIDWNVPTVVAVGRLAKQKGFPHLLVAFAAVARTRSAQLLILGEGPDRTALTRQATQLGIADRVLMPGFRSNPFAYVARSRVFVLSSLWEGFGNVIVEAMACRVPIISTDCPAGPAEILTHEVNGLLVPPSDPDALATALARVLDDPSLGARLTRAASVRMRDFSIDTGIDAYHGVLGRAIAATSGRVPRPTGL